MSVNRNHPPRSNTTLILHYTPNLLFHKNDPDITTNAKWTPKGGVSNRYYNAAAKTAATTARARPLCWLRCEAAAVTTGGDTEADAPGTLPVTPGTLEPDPSGVSVTVPISVVAPLMTTLEPEIGKEIVESPSVTAGPPGRRVVEPTTN